MTAPKTPSRFTVKTHKMPDESVFYDRIIPGLFVLLGIVTVVLIVFAIGVFTGVIAWG